MVLVTIIISRRIDRARVYISNWSVDLPAVRIVRKRGPYRLGRLGHGPYHLDTSQAGPCPWRQCCWPVLVSMSNSGLAEGPTDNLHDLEMM